MGFNLLYCNYGCFRIPQRVILTVMLTLAVCYNYIYRVHLSIALTEMMEPLNISGLRDENFTGTVCRSVQVFRVAKNISYGQTFKWSHQQKGNILGILFLGYLLTHLPFGILADKFGGKHFILIPTALCAVLSILTPASTMIGEGYLSLFILRFVMGLCQGGIFPVLSVLITQWIPHHERGRLGGAIFSGQHLGSIAGNTVSGVMMGLSESWAFPFYIWGFLGIAWFLIGLVTVFSKPSSHPFLTEDEDQYLKEQISPIGKRPPLPWLKMLKSPVVLSLLAGQLGHDYVIFMLVTDLPLYMKEVLQFDVVTNGYFIGLIFLTLFISSFVSGYLADLAMRRNIISLINLRRTQMMISSIGCAGCLLFAGYAKCRRSIAVTFLTLGSMMMGPFYSGVKLGPVDVSVHFSGTLTAIVSGVAGLSGVATTQTVAHIAIHQTVEEWQRIYWITFLVSAMTSIVFVTYFKPERVQWDYVEEEEGK